MPSPRPTDDAADLALAAWQLWFDATQVVWMRSLRMMSGGALARREARWMVSEKIAANATLLPALMAGGLDASPESTARRALAHYGRPVAANRRRLSRSNR